MKSAVRSVVGCVMAAVGEALAALIVTDWLVLSLAPSLSVTVRPTG